MYHSGDSDYLKRSCLHMTNVYAKIEVSNNRKDDISWQIEHIYMQKKEIKW